MANEQNLIPFNKRTESEQREYAKKGGQKSGEVRRQRKAMKEQMEMLLSLPFKQSESLEFMKDLGIEEDNLDNQMALIVAMYGKALKGDVQAFNTIREVVQDEKTVKDEEKIQIINDLPLDEEDDDI
ncbi:MAG: hypothetical protein ACLUWN_01180 [Clostridia bacterium]|jgi:putative uncharacterized protein gbs1119|nr:MAG TPA: hypothetical protein [Caudoviricetes sp.]DAY01661.1 MAG TPA: hypothetical protein [Caudoviricetes sp.]